MNKEMPGPDVDNTYYDTLSCRLYNVGLNLAELEEIVRNGGRTVAIEDGPHRRDYLQINEQFLKGARKAYFAAWESMVWPYERNEEGLEKAWDENGYSLAEGVVHEVQKFTNQKD